MSAHKKHIILFVKRLAGFALFAGVFYTVVLPAWVVVMPSKYTPNVFFRITSYGHTFSRLQEAGQEKNVNFLFLGSSHAYRGFDTRIFRESGYRVFNLGSGSQTPAQTRVLIERYLDNLNPDVVIWEIDPFAVSGDGVESALDLVSNDRQDIHSLKMVFQTAHPKVWNTFTYALYRDLFGLNDSVRETARKNEDLYIPGGFVQKDLKRFKYTKHPNQEIAFNARMMRILSCEIGKIQESGKRIILVRTPVTSAFYNSYTNNAEFTRRMSDLAPYIDFNDRVQLDDSLHYYDEHHLNQEGVEIFNEAFLEMLEEDLSGGEVET